MTIPFPDGACFTISGLCMIFGVKRQTLYNLMSQHREKFGPRMYKPGRRGRLSRVLSESDFALLKGLFRIYVK